MYIASFLVLMTIILTLCTEEIKQQKQEQVTRQIAQLEDSGKFPKLERNNPLAEIEFYKRM